MNERAADQKFHRQIVDALGIGSLVGLLGEQPALREQIAQRASDRLEAFAVAGILQ
jgi:hypothetical protein